MVLSDTSRAEHIYSYYCHQIFFSKILVLNPQSSNSSLLGNFSKTEKNQSYEKFENFILIQNFQSLKL